MMTRHGPRTLMTVHAHPDDETLATGALIAHLVGQGVECVLLTATRGEQGEVRPGTFTGPAEVGGVTPMRVTGLRFHGRGSEYFRIWIVNTLLTRLLIPVGYLALQGKRRARNAATA